MNLGGSKGLIAGIIVGIILGLLLGMLLFWAGPLKVQYTGGYSYDLYPEEKAKYVQLVADSYALDKNVARANSFLDAWSTEEKQQAIAAAIPLAEAEGDPGKVQRLTDLSGVLGLGAPAQPGEATPLPAQPTPEGRPASALIRIRNGCIVFIVVLLVLIAIYALVRWLLGRRAAAVPAPEREVPERAAAAVPAPMAPAEEWQGIGQPPLGHFFTTYKLGEDTYDESFSIENAAGEFLGECGVGISETIGKGEPDRVTAFEVWLFDKSDIRTVTKVLMSDHAFHDETLRAKLAPKGEAVLATVGVPFVLETTGLLVQVTVTDLRYGDAQLPPKSFFQQLTVELLATGRPPAV